MSAFVAAGAAVRAWVVRAWEVRVGADQGGHGVGAHMAGTGVPGAGVGLGIGPTIGGLLLTIGAQLHIIMDPDLIARCGATPTLAGEPATRRFPKSVTRFSDKKRDNSKT